MEGSVGELSVLGFEGRVEELEGMEEWKISRLLWGFERSREGVEMELRLCIWTVYSKGLRRCSPRK